MPYPEKWKCCKCGDAAFSAYGNKKKNIKMQPYCKPCLERYHPEGFASLAAAQAAAQKFVDREKAN